MEDDVVVRYGWASVAEPRCVTLVRDRSPEDVLRGLAQRSAIEVGPGPVDEAERWVLSQEDYQLPASVIWAVAVGGWTLGVEENGWQGVRPEIATALAAGTELAAYHWTVNADMTFLRAVDGAVVRWFDPLLDYDDGVLKATSPNGPPLPEEAGLPFGLGAPREAAFGLLERLTGVSVQPDLATPDRLAIAAVVTS
jgi:hypothetical protein